MEPGFGVREAGLRAFVGALLVTLMLAACGSNTQRGAPHRPASEGRLESGEGTLAYEVCGEGDSVVLIHGGLVDRRLWDREFAALCPGYRVVRYDVRPLGASTLTGDSVSHVDDLLSLMDALAIDRASLVGLSFGGSIALEFALAHPERIEGLVLVGASARGYPYGNLPEMQRVYRLAATDPVAASRMFVDSTRMIADPVTGGEALYRMLVDNVAEWRVPRYVTTAVWPRLPGLLDFSEIRAPTLVVVGEEDYPDLLGTADSLAARIPDARLVVVSGAAHHVNLDRPRYFSAICGPSSGNDLGAEPLSQVTDSPRGDLVRDGVGSVRELEDSRGALDHGRTASGRNLMLVYVRCARRRPAGTPRCYSCQGGSRFMNTERYSTAPPSTAR